jgi:hypothetical protein
MAWAAVGAAAVTVVGGKMMSDSAGEAGGQMGQANALTQKQIEEAKAEQNAAYAPYAEVGGQANQRLAYLLGLTPKTSMVRGAGKQSYTLDDFTNAGAGKWAQDAYDEYKNYEKSHQGDDLSGWQISTKDGMKSLGDLSPLVRSDLNTSDGQYGSLLNKFSQNDLNSDVVYNSGLQFGLNEGTKGINRLASSNGGIDSGATLKALTRYANDYGTTKAEGAYGRFDNDRKNTFGMLSGQQSMGLNATDRNQTLNNQLLTGSIASNMQTAENQANAGMAGTSALMGGINNGIGNYLYGQRSGNSSVTGAGSVGGTSYATGQKSWYA